MIREWIRSVRKKLRKLKLVIREIWSHDQNMADNTHKHMTVTVFVLFLFVGGMFGEEFKDNMLYIRYYYLLCIVPKFNHKVDSLFSLHWLAHKVLYSGVS